MQPALRLIAMRAASCWRKRIVVDDAPALAVLFKQALKSICLGTHFPAPYMSNIKAICALYGIDADRVTHEAGGRDMVQIRWVEPPV